MFVKIGLIVVIFMSSGVAFLNLSYIKYGIPSHYDGGWEKFIISLFIAVFFGVIAIKKMK